MTARFSAEPVLAGLKDFQRSTVEHAFDRLFVAPDSTKRFLVADEVGLGKTMVARGVIAKAIERLENDGVERVDIVYICSNADIAAQNVRKLDIAGSGAAIASRLTLLAKQVQNLRERSLNIVALTPGTSFEQTSFTGKQEERVLLYALLRDAWELGSGTGPKNVLQATTRRAETFRDALRSLDRASIDDGIAGEFAAGVKQREAEECQAGQPTIRERFDELSQEFARTRQRILLDQRQRRNAVISELRGLLAASCVEALEPDLVAASEERAAELRSLLRDYQRELYGVEPEASAHLREIGAQIQALLSRYIARTERVGAAGRRDSMLRQVVRTPPLGADDLRQYLLVQSVADSLEQPDVMELWKSAPYLLNFLDGYKLRSRFDAECATPDGERKLAAVIEGQQDLLLGSSRLAAYEELDPGGQRLRALAEDVIDSEAWRLLWIPPALPYHELGGAYAHPDLAGFTKRLVFSAWRAVPRSAAGLLSYGHAVRKNVALAHGAGALAADQPDPWATAFELAAGDRLPTDSELVPFWIYPLEHGAFVERQVLALPMSRELDRLTALRNALAVYRLAFGQARQEDVIDHLLTRLGPERAEALAAELRIDLRPPTDLRP